MSQLDLNITIFFLCPMHLPIMQKSCCKAKELMQHSFGYLVGQDSFTLLDLPCLGIASTFILPLQTMGIDVQLAALTFP